MARGLLYEDGYRPRLSGHETFPLRYGWLKKAVDAAVDSRTSRSKRSAFLAEDAIVRFGVGKNMVASIRHWASAAGMIEETGGRTRATPLGRRIFGPGGLDPYMENPATAWLVHWHLCGDPLTHRTTWFWAFSHHPASLFERDDLARGMRRLAEARGWPRAAASTIRSDVACFVRSYTSRPPSGKASYEDALESPLAELGLVRPVGRRDTFRFVRGSRRSLGPGVLCHAVTRFWTRHSTTQTLSFEALAHEPGSPGLVFLLDEGELADRLAGIEEASGGLYQWSETAGLKQVVRKRTATNEDALGFLDGDYGIASARAAA